MISPMQLKPSNKFLFFSWNKQGYLSTAPDLTFLRRRLFDDLNRTRTLNCDDDETESDVSSDGSDSVALSVIIDQDLGIAGITTPPSVSPPPLPLVTTGGDDYNGGFYGTVSTIDNYSPLTTVDGDQI